MTRKRGTDYKATPQSAPGEQAERKGETSKAPATAEALPPQGGAEGAAAAALGDTLFPLPVLGLLSPASSSLAVHALTHSLCQQTLMATGCALGPGARHTSLPSGAYPYVLPAQRGQGCGSLRGNLASMQAAVSGVSS